MFNISHHTMCNTNFCTQHYFGCYTITIDNTTTANLTSASNLMDTTTILLPEAVHTSMNASQNCTNSPACPYQCSSSFYCNHDSGLCQPLCSQWKEYPRSTEVTTDVFTLLSACIALISGSAMLIIACIRWRQV